MKLKSVLFATALFALAGPAFAQQSPAPPQTPRSAGGFERADSNNDGVITRDEVRAARSATFTRLDTNRDGFLVREELQAGRPRGNSGGQHGGAPGDIFARADANADGNVTRAEFDRALDAAQAAKAAAQIQRRQAMFDRVDANRDGTITRAEADAARASLPHLRPADPEGMGPRQGGLVNPDTNNDGKVSLAEWLARPDPLFDRADTNNDGRLTREEAAAAGRQGRGERRPNRP